MARRRHVLRTLAWLVGLVGTVLAVGASAGATLDAATCRWRVVQRVNEAEGLAVIGPRNVWVGLGGPGTVSLEHWDGTRWSRVRVPSTRFGGVIDDVEASSPGEVWAVGPDGAAARWRKGRIELVATPLKESRLSALSSTGPDDVWAVGMRTPNQTGHPLIEHWDGRRWTVSFAEDAFGGFSDVLALSPRDAWAVGWRKVSTVGDPQLFRSMVMHWDGRHWYRVEPPGRPAAQLDALSGSAGEIWASAGLRQHSYAFARWDGRRWSLVAGPTVQVTDKAFPPQISDLQVLSSAEIIAVGRKGYAHGTGVILRWDGKRWSSEQAPPVLSWESVDAAAGEVWTLGDLGVGGSLIARCTP